MAISIIGNSGVVSEVEANSRATRVTNRPLDPGALGAYGVQLESGTMAAGLAANAEVFQFRWTSSTATCVVDSVQIWAGSITAFTAGFCNFKLLIARSWSADGSGGTAATITGNNGKMRTSFATTTVGAIRISSTAALTAGTKTLDSQGVGSAGGSVTATAGDKLLGQREELLNAGNLLYPIALAQNEGFVIRATVPATGTWTFGVNVRWTEVSTY